MEAHERNSTRTSQRPRRPRAARACDLCRAKKNKCDESYPCSYCKGRNVTCVYQGLSNNSRRYTAEYVKQLEDEIKRLSTSSQGQPVVRFDQSRLENPGPHHESHDTPHPNIPASARKADEEEISGVNGHTDGVEFYGSSSSFALLSHVQRSGQKTPDSENTVHLVSSLLNATFQTSPTASHGDESNAGTTRADYYPQCRSFVEGFFSTIHYIHPILDKRDFLHKCEALWLLGTDDTSPRLPPSFVPLYFSVLSLGAIVGNREEEHIDGLSNLQWSRKFFNIAWTCCHQLGLVTNLEMVQCFFLLVGVIRRSSITQRFARTNSTHIVGTYMYTGFAVRTALAMGMNREPGSNTQKTTAQLKAESRTWWEISFSIGRPDTLGADIYHNRRIPLVRVDGVTDEAGAELLEPPHCAIIGCMVDLSKITRSICQKIYFSNPSIHDMIALTNHIETELDAWVEGLPHAIRPSIPNQLPQRSSLNSAKDALWIKRQRLVLSIRYHNLKILLFGSLLIRSSPAERANVPGCLENVRKCLESAKQTINVIYQTYAHNDFFQTWFYNAIYTVFAASVVLLYVTQGSAIDEEILSLFELVNMAIEILESMDESVVSLEAARLLRHARDKAQSRESSGSAPRHNYNNMSHTALDTDSVSPPFAHVEGHSTHLSHYWGSLGFLDVNGMDFDMATQLGVFDQNNPMHLF
ncbi:hypothetical protein DM02DRAFT_543275 [Periconia macrospinosa]|uniref:Zn(2)-C6 fungal-type domain-containing protein n=1 Tax=Periconia macrospinosa TaxID=97972 RepID=A0A2V1D3M0_9PLEO|nr:hypothetical protein DM02DRAFT_543275 [Periconia macrospinosa]